MPAGGLATAAVAQGVSGLISGVTGYFQKRKANRMLKGLQYPVESMPAEELQNQQLAQIRANTGLPSAQYQQAKDNIQGNQNFAIGSAQDRRAALDVIPSVNANTNKATLGLDVANANARVNNEKTLLNVNNQVAATKRDLFDKNVRGKYMQQYNYAMQLLGAGNQNFTSGLDSIGTAALMGMSGGKDNTQIPNYA